MVIDISKDFQRIKNIDINKLLLKKFMQIIFIVILWIYRNLSSKGSFSGMIGEYTPSHQSSQPGSWPSEVFSPVIKFIIKEYSKFWLILDLVTRILFSSKVLRLMHSPGLPV